MKLHQIVPLFKEQSIYPAGYTSRDFNINTAAFQSLVRKALGRGKDFGDIKKLNIYLYEEENKTSDILNYTSDKGYISEISQGGFQYDKFAAASDVQKVIMLGEITIKALKRIDISQEERVVVIGVIQKIIDKAPELRNDIEHYMHELRNTMNQK